jgi:hypothetical protein
MPAARSIPIPSGLRQTLDGLMLGDGNLWAAKTRPTCNAMYRQSSISPDWLADIASRFHMAGYRCSVYFDRVHRHKSGAESKIWFLQSGASTDLTVERRRWYPEGRKRCPMDFEMNAEIVRQWYLGDGTLRSLGFAAFCAEWFSRDEIAWLVDGLRGLLGSNVVRTAVRRDGWNIELTKPGTAALFDLIGPCPHPSLARKFRGYMERSPQGLLPV